jgi:hypothetical protein
MTRGKPSVIENHPSKAQIDALLAAGTPLQDVAREFPDVSVHSLSRYRRRSQRVTAASGDSLENQIAVWLQRSEELYQASAASLDFRAQGQAIAGALRTLEIAHKNQNRMEEKAMAARDLPTDGSPISAEEAAKFGDYMDFVIAEAGRTNYASVEVRTLALQLAVTKNPELMAVCLRLAEDPALLSQTLILMRGAA